MILPPYVRSCIDALETAGYSAYAVGGCVRDHLLGLEPPSFIHFPLLLTADGRRLSKRNADAGLDDLRPRFSPEEILGRLAYLAGFNPDMAPKSAEELVKEFDWNKVPQADIRIPDGLFTER